MKILKPTTLLLFLLFIVNSCQVNDPEFQEDEKTMTSARTQLKTQSRDARVTNNQVYLNSEWITVSENEFVSIYTKLTSQGVSFLDGCDFVFQSINSGYWEEDLYNGLKITDDSFNGTVTFRFENLLIDAFYCFQGQPFCNHWGDTLRVTLGGAGGCIIGSIDMMNGISVGNVDFNLAKLRACRVCASSFPGNA
ncbi:hypothetical protein [uncultured Kordia sp.]|uniref:hypothetical protein n=1 Tax=uncultured Kordia sp. TaxID=507699 RepID=UPI00260260AC|nr:hypothetical protein [uncultured Kordia sp.]